MPPRLAEQLEIKSKIIARLSQSIGTLPVKDRFAVARDLAAAFARYPLCDWIFEGASDPEQARLRLFEILLSDFLVKKAEFVRARGYGAVAIWIRSERLPLIGVKEGRAIYRALRCGLGGKVARRLLETHIAMIEHHPSPPHDYLFLIGVHPEFQHRGIGTQMISFHLNKTDRIGRSCFLETSDPLNVALYNRLGFEVYSCYVTDSESPRSWGMWRNPVAI